MPSTNMDLEIQTLEGIFTLENVPQTSTVSDMKNQLETVRGIPASKSEVSFMGIKLDDENVLVSDFLKIGSNSFTVLQATEDMSMEEKKVAMKIWSDKAISIITGDSRNFKSRRVMRNREMTFKLPAPPTAF